MLTVDEIARLLVEVEDAAPKGSPGTPDAWREVAEHLHRIFEEALSLARSDGAHDAMLEAGERE